MINIRKFCKKMTLGACVLLSMSSLANATLITGLINNDDISNITVTTPQGWTVHNTDLLFDGETDRYTKIRFAGYQRKGSELNDNNVFNISVMLNQNVNVSGISFFNDWRHHLKQQVKSMDVSLFNEQQDFLWSGSFSGLKQSTWDEISLVNFDTPVMDVRQLNFAITGSQGNHFEIRELLVATSAEELSEVSVNSPASAALIFLALAGLVFARIRN